MVFKEYKNPEETNWRGWLENGNGDVIGFVKLDGKISFE